MASELEFDWDPANTGHIASHLVTPEEVEEVFANDEVDIDYDVIGGEQRWTVAGETDECLSSPSLYGTIWSEW